MLTGLTRSTDHPSRWGVQKREFIKGTYRPIRGWLRVIYQVCKAYARFPLGNSLPVVVLERQSPTATAQTSARIQKGDPAILESSTLMV